MAGLRTALALLLMWGAMLLPPAVGQPPGEPPLELVGDAQATPGEPVVVRLAPREGVTGPELVGNGRFDDGQLWQTSTREVDPGGLVVARDGVMSLSATPAKDGAAFAVHRTNVGLWDSYALSYRARQTSPWPAQVQVYLQLANPEGVSGQKFFTHQVGNEWTQYDWTWSPGNQSGQATLQLRLLALAGRAQGVEFDDVSLRGVAPLRWQVDEGVLGLTGGLAARVSFADEGPHRIEASASRGGRSWRGDLQVEVAEPRADAHVVVESPAPSLDAELAIRLEGLRGPTPLRDRDFHDLGDVWTWAGLSVMGSLSATSRDDPFKGPWLDVAGTPARNGTLALTQSVLLPAPSQATRFSAVMEGSPAATRFRLVVREIMAVGAPVESFALAPRLVGEGLVVLDWTPSSPDVKSLQVQVGVDVTTGAGPLKWSVRQMTATNARVEWSIDGIAHRESAPFLRTAFSGPGPHVVQASWHQGAATEQAAVVVDVRRPTTEFKDLLPEVAPRSPGLPVRLDAALLPRGTNQIINGAFDLGTAGWTFVNQVGGSAGMSVVPGSPPALRLDGNSTTRGAMQVYQAAAAVCEVATCRLSFEYRSGGAAQPMALLVVDQGNGPVESRLTLKPNAEWQSASLDGQRGGFGKSTVYLRAVLPEETTGWVEFRSVAFRAATTFSLVGGSAVMDGLVGLAVPEAAGNESVDLVITDGWNQTTVHDESVWFADVGLHTTFDDRAYLRLPSSGPGAVELSSSQSSFVWSPGPGAAYPLPEFADGSTRFVLLPEDQGLVLGLGRPGTNQSSSYLVDDLLMFVARPVARGEPPVVVFAGASTRLIFRVALDDATASQMHAFVSSPGGGERQVRLTEHGGFWEGTADVGRSLAGSDVAVAYRVRDGWGNEVTLGNASAVSVPPNTTFATGLGVMAVAALVAAAHLIHYMRARRRS
ncbi:MAG: hypothetical protein ACYC2H_05480 [Thermoplasmatota archaeon]